MQTDYHAYLADPGIRERIDREVAHLRAEAIQRFIVAPVAGFLASIAAIGRAIPATTNP